MARGDPQFLFFTALVGAAALGLLVQGASAQSCSTIPCTASTDCCSQYGYCGNTSAYCGPGCVGGPCISPAPAIPPAPLPPTQCSPSKRCNVSTDCCSQDGYCGTSFAFCGAGCSNGPCSRAPMRYETGWSLLTPALFHRLFPNRLPLYSFVNLQIAHLAYPALGTTGTLDTQKREVAAFLANVAHESGELQYAEEIDQSDIYCDTTYPQYPCAPGKKYFGRGALEITWNYNYGACGAALKLPLLANPDLVAQDGVIAFKTAYWYWIAGSNCHKGILGGSFSSTIRAINGPVECNQPVGSVGHNEMLNRVSYYQEFCSVLGVSPGTDLQC